AGASEMVSLRTGPEPALAPSAAGPVKGLGVVGDPESGRVALQWTPDSKATRYRLEIRKHESDGDWQTAKMVSEARSQIGGLQPDTEYDIRVIAVDNDAIDAPATETSIRTARRIPAWSDLVTDDSNESQVDVSRVQMLVFTLISAVFVGLKILQSGTIPPIPDSYVALMGISNGLYLAAKFTGR
ncbi:MAG TPA: fibronectin type III domain-containing protein, partial [Polyangiaceae bacterium]|nr:fibronectin type III domain-containing protein [Polyangiaceae bacterium]